MHATPNADERAREQSSLEVRQLRSVNRDLVSLLALHAMWMGARPATIVETLIDALLGMLRLDIAYVRLAWPGERVVEAACAGANPDAAKRAREVGAALSPWLSADTSSGPITTENPLGGGEIRLLVGQFPLHGKCGAIAIGSHRSTFPTETEAALFKIAINQTAIGLDDAQLLEHVERLALEASNLGIWDYNPTTGELKWSDRCKELYGLPPDAEVDYDVFLAGIHPEDREQTQRAIQQALTPESGGRYKVEYRVIGTKGGVERWIRAEGRALFDESGRAYRFLGIGLDITQQKHAEAERELFLAALGHDLRNPLGAIQMAAGLVLRNNPDPSIEKATRRIASSATKMARLVEQLIDFAAARLGRGIELSPRPFDMADLCRETITEAELSYGGRSVLFQGSGNLVGRWDYDRTSQAVANLVYNALEHGAPERPVEVSATMTGRHVVLRVWNQGSPIPDAARAHLFDPFRRGKKKGRGLGLGLYITREIVLAHHGTIDFESNETGTTFTVKLPIDVDAAS